ncbi:ABC transporter permease [Humibacter ginsenosidimutans]|uniref:ABC transporter permease n=1 Tax=Humibacter ginsenosidimutans TaxID=2599293 RepID=A0A5B8M525_9MICO|nr:ABC transporter permease [Humibacter ginsenosidimutans]QDZ15453.1 ABC transporter permease [Humibacter ginsenosidimutans]
MFVAWRDLRFARGRFVLIGSVVALITLLVGFLAGLTGGLAAQNVSAVLALPGDRIVLQQPSTGQPSFSESSISSKAVASWRKASGVTHVLPVGIVQGKAKAHGTTAAVALFGLTHSGGQADSGTAGTAMASALTALAPTSDDSVGLSAGAAKDLGGARVGDTVSILGSTFTVSSVDGDLWYSHTPVAAFTPAAWAQLDKGTGGSGEATALAVSGDADWNAVADSTHTSATTPLSSLAALDAFKSEIGSLGLMIAMLFGISALVVGAFFTVWTMQRSADVAVLKALGATTKSLVRDALGQATVVLVVGIGIGMLVVTGLGLLASGALPFLLSPLTTVAPAVAMAVLGLAGAAVALRNVTKSDPLTALGSNR